MEQDNYLGRIIEQTKNRTEYDAACKRLLAEKQILARILKECVPEFKDADVDTIAEQYIEGKPEITTVKVMPDEKAGHEFNGDAVAGLNTEDKSLNEGTVYYDILFKAISPTDGEPIQLIINLEAQLRYHLSYPLMKRAIYYAARLLSSQNGKTINGKDYSGLQKVYSIWVCMNVPKDRKNTITRYHITEENIIGNVKENQLNYNLMSVMILGLNSNEPMTKSILGMLSVLLDGRVKPKEKKQYLNEKYKIRVTEEIDQEVAKMCNLSEGVYEDGVREGREQGLRDGIEKGSFSEKVNTVLAMLKKKCDYDFIAEITKLSKERIEEIAKKNKLV